MKTDVIKPFFITNKRNNSIRIGCAVPSEGKAYDVYLLKGSDKSENVGKLVDVFVPALLGVLRFNTLACGPVAAERGDNAAALQVITTAALTALLAENGAKGASSAMLSGFSEYSQGASTGSSLHKIHHVSDSKAWRDEMRPQVSKLGGLGQLDRLQMTDAELTAMNVTWLPTEWRADTTSGNMLVVQGFSETVSPLIQASGASAEVMAARILQIAGEDNPAPVEKQLKRVAGLSEKTGISLSGSGWKKHSTR